MDLTPHVEELRRRLVAAAEGGGPEASAVAERLVAAVESAAWLTLLEALSAAAEELTSELAPASVEVRLRGRNPHFVVTGAPADGQVDMSRAAMSADQRSSVNSDMGPEVDVGPDGDDDAAARINLRLPKGLKRRVERAAKRDRLSVNAWLVRVAADGVEGGRRSGTQRGGRHTGWVR